MKQFVSYVTDLIISKKIFAKVGIIDISSIPNIESVETIPGITIVGGSKVTVPALSTPAATIASLFTTSDVSIWNSGNTRLVDLVKRLVAPPVTSLQLSELSSVLFKSIMASGPQTAKDCASALKVLAAKDPKAIHQIVAQHISNLQKTSTNQEAANSFITSLMNKGKAVEAMSNDSSDDAAIKNLLVQLQHSKIYSRDELLTVRERMGSLGKLGDAPEEMKNLKLTRRK